MKKKLGLIAVMLLAVVFTAACGEESPWKIHRDIEDWKNEKYLELPSHISMLDKYVAMVIPSEDEVEGYEDSSFYWADCEEDVSIFDIVKYGLPYTYCACLELTFAEDTYPEHKEKILSEYPFLEEPILDDDGTYLMPVSKGKIGSFDIWIMNDRDENQPQWERNNKFTNFPKDFGFIAFNDEVRIIRIAYAIDDSLDYYSDAASLEAHIRTSFDIDWD